MIRNPLLYLGALLVVLIAVGILVNRGVVQGVVRNADIGLSTDASSYTIGGTTSFTGTIDFSDGEEIFIHQVALVAAGPSTQDLDVALPLEQGTFNLISAVGASGTSLSATVVWANLIAPGRHPAWRRNSSHGYAPGWNAPILNLFRHPSIRHAAGGYAAINSPWRHAQSRVPKRRHTARIGSDR